MAQAALTRTKINTKPTQLARKADPAFQGRPRAGRPAQGHRVSGDARSSARDASRVVVELEYGITYPPEAVGEPWRAVFHRRRRPPPRSARPGGGAGAGRRAPGAASRQYGEPPDRKSVV